MSSPPAGSAAPTRVLVVEDDPTLRLLLTDSLSDEGYEVRSADGGEAGLQLLCDWAPELVLLDFTMPGLDGRQFRAAQRAMEPPTSEIPVVLVTGLHDPHTLTEELAVAALLRKPFDLDDLTDTVGRIVRAPR